jgi:surfeit locus 1 family protein
VIVSGTPDFENEIVVTGRSRNGSPGVYIVTPVRVPGSIPAVLVNRGWVYAPDAATVDLARWREARTTYHGWVQPFAQPHASSPSTRPRSVRELTRSAAERLLPYPVTGVVIAQDSAGESTPARLPAPRLDNGPHLSYAIQWFSFAVIALAGAGAVVHRARQRDRTGATGA